MEAQFSSKLGQPSGRHEPTIDFQPFNDKTVEDVAELCELASSLLSKEPSEEIINALAAIAPSLRQRISDDTAHQLNDIVKSYGDEFQVNDLKQEFRELFIASQSGRYIPPFESAFRATVESGRQGRPSEAACAEVEASYNRFGFIPAKLKMDMRIKAFGWPDHVAIELAFLAFLLRTAQGREKHAGMDMGRRFAQAHVNTWIPRFSSILFQQSATIYFKFVAQLLAEIAKLSALLTERSG